MCYLNLFHKNGEKLSDTARPTQRLVSTVFSVLKKFKATGSTENHNRSGRLSLESERDYHCLERMVKKDRRAPLGDVTAKFNKHRDKQVSSKTVK